MHINQLSISNFKTIQSLELKGFKKINLLIGKPNVGKSNFLEALSLFTVPYFKDIKDSKLSNLIRIENFAELFYNGNVYEDCIVNLNLKMKLSVSEDKNLKINRLEKHPPHQGNITSGFNINLPKGTFAFIDNNLLLVNISNNIKKYPLDLKAYYFASAKSSDSSPHRNGIELFPPYGSNLMRVIEHHKQLKEEVNQFFTPYNLKLVFDKGSQNLKVLRESEDGDIFILPYSAVADTLQRIIFYKAAISSNENSVLLFEEPEAHAFPPYIAHFTQEVIQSESNQFIMTTHSPIIVNDFLENAIDDLAIFMVDYKDNQTVVHRLEDEELREIQKYGVDIFINYENYLS